jgi:hypothetical protein
MPRDSRKRCTSALKLIAVSYRQLRGTLVELR